MSAWLLGSVVLLIGGMAPAGWMAARGTAAERLVGLELGSVVATLELMLFAQAVNDSLYFVVPLVLALMSFAGTLVYTRLLAPRP